MPLDWGKLEAETQPKSKLDWSSLDGSTPKQTPNPATEASPNASKVMAFAKGADEALLGIPGNVAAGLRAVTHGETFDQAYKDIKGAGETSSANHPGYYAGGMVGGVAASLPLMPEAAATWGGRAIQGSKLGAGMAGVSEFSDSKDIGKSADAALSGGALGLVASPALEGLAHVGAKVASPVVSTVRGAINPEQEAARRVSGALKLDRQIGGQGLSASEFMAARAKGDPVGIADLGGQTTRELARSAANTSPEAEQTLKNLTENRFGTQAERITDSIGSSGIANFDKREALKEAARVANKPLYDRAYAYSANGLWNDELANMVNSPAVRDAIRGAEERASNQAVIDGGKPIKNPFLIDAEGNVSLKTNKDGSVAYPTLQFWDVVKKNLDHVIGVEKRSSGDITTLTGIKQKLVEQLDAQNPYYKQARGTAQTFFGANDAVEAGAKFVGSNMDLAEVRKNLAGMSGPERKLFSDGFATEFINKINSIPDRRNVVNQIFNSNAARQKVELALGKTQARELEAQLHVEEVMNQFKQAVGGNSTTAKQLAQLGLVGTGGAYLTGNDGTLGGAAGIAAALARGRVDARVANKVAEMLVSNKPEQLRQVTQMVAGSEKLMSIFKKLSVGASSEAGRSVGDYYGSKK